MVSFSKNSVRDTRGQGNGPAITYDHLCAPCANASCCKALSFYILPACGIYEFFVNTTVVVLTPR